MTSYWATIDTVVMGRRTYDVARKQSPNDFPYAGVKTYVCSRTLPVGTAGTIEIVNNGVALVRKLKDADGKDIYIMGGSTLAATLFKADLIDEISVNVHPVLLGAGVPLVSRLSKRVKLELVTSETWKNGCVLLTYRVKRST
jgi:dihydrofolate reductase